MAAIMICMGISIVWILPIKAEAGTSKKTVTNAYEKYAGKHDIEYVDQIDIDGNGIKEMLYFGNGNKVGICSYSAKKKKVVKIRTMLKH